MPETASIHGAGKPLPKDNKGFVLIFSPDPRVSWAEQQDTYVWEPTALKTLENTRVIRIALLLKGGCREAHNTASFERRLPGSAEYPKHVSAQASIHATGRPLQNDNRLLARWLNTNPAC